MNLNLLRSLDVLLEVRNIAAAASKLGISEGAVVRQLGRLRLNFNDPLLIPDGPDFLLTQRARELRGVLKAVLSNLESVMDGPTFDPAACSRVFSIAGSDYLAKLMMPPLIETMALRAPRARIAFHYGEAGYRQLLGDENVDLAAAVVDVLPAHVHGRVVVEDRLVCAMRSGHPLAAQPLTLADYVRWPHARVSGGSNQDGLVDQFLASRGMQRDVRLTVPFFWSALRIFCQHDLLLTIPEHIAVTLAADSPVVWRPLPFDAPRNRYWLLWHSRRHNDPAHQWFRLQVLDLMQRSALGFAAPLASAFERGPGHARGAFLL